MIIYKRKNIGEIMDIFKTDKKRKNKVGIAFGGGGARGFAHLGVLKAFEENGIVFDEVAGTSVGSIVGSLYAFGLSSDEMFEAAKKLKASDIKTSKLFFRPSSTEGIENLVKSLIGDAHFEDMKKPLTVVAVDLKSAKEVHITHGSVVKAVAGSCAVPGFFEPVVFGDLNLVDGGLQNTIPADVLRKSGCKYVVGVDINPTRGNGTESTKTLDVLEASLRILMKANAVKGKIYSDVSIDVDTSEFKSTSLEGADEMYKRGYEAGLKAVPKIKELIGEANKRTFSWFGLYKKNRREFLRKEDEMNIWQAKNKKLKLKD